MTKKEFQQLQREIHQKEDELAELQKLHIKETGRRYIISGPLPDDDSQAKCIECGGIDGKHLFGCKMPKID